MVFVKGGKQGKAAKKAAKPETDKKVVDKVEKVEELKDADIASAVNQQKIAQAANKPAEKPLVKDYSAPVGVSTYSVWNMSTNPILLRLGTKEIEIISHECKQIEADVFEGLAKLKFIRDLLDKGILKANKKIELDQPLRTDASIEKAPEYLTQDVERSDGQMTIKAEIKKNAAGKAFTPAGTFDIKL